MSKFKPGQSGNPGGRPRGSHTKRELHDLLIERFGEAWCPVVQLAEIAMDPTTSIEIRVRCLTEVAPYYRARLKTLSLEARTSSLEELVALSMCDP